MGNDVGRDRKLKALLEPGETLLWSGRSTFHVYLTGPQRALLGFFLLAPGCLWFLGFAATRGDEDAWGMAGVFCLALMVFAAKPVWAFVRSLGEVYGITDQRVMIVDAFGRLHHVVDLMEAPGFYLAPRRTRRGTVLLAADPGWWSQEMRPQPYVEIPRLRGVEDPEGVIALMEAQYPLRRAVAWGDVEPPLP